MSEGFLKGNQFWKLRSTHGKPRLFSDAATLWEEAARYFDWCDRHPWERVEIVKYKDTYDEAGVPVGRPYTLSGLTHFLGVSERYLRAAGFGLLEKLEKGTATPAEVELLETIERIEAVIRTQQIEGAAVGAYNNQIVGRLQGLVERTSIEQSGESVVRVAVLDPKTAEDIDKLE